MWINYHNSDQATKRYHYLTWMKFHRQIIVILRHIQPPSAELESKDIYGCMAFISFHIHRAPQQKSSHHHHSFHCQPVFATCSPSAIHVLAVATTTQYCGNIQLNQARNILIKCKWMRFQEGRRCAHLPLCHTCSMLNLTREFTNQSIHVLRLQTEYPHFFCNLVWPNSTTSLFVLAAESLSILLESALLFTWFQFDGN